MKTIELISGEQKAQFTTKSVTFDGKEYFYSNMSHVTNHEEQCFYTFTYQDETKTLPYEKKDSKILAAIFSQVKALESAASTAANASVAEKPPVEASEKKQPPTVSQAPVSEESKEDVTACHSQEGIAEASSQQEQQAATDAPMDARAEKKAEKAEKRAEKQRIKAQKKAEKEAAAAEKKEQYDNKEKDPEKTQKIKKSLIVFGIVVAAIALLALIYFLIFGTKEDPTTINPSVQESQSYDDIDELINDLQ